MSQTGEGTQLSTTCVAALPDGEAVYALIVRSDSERFSSTIHRITDFEADDEVVYKAKKWLTSLWVSPAGRVYAVDADGQLHSNRSGTWQVTELSKGRALNWVWGFNDDALFACGRNGAVVRFANSQWQPFDENVDGHLYGLHGTAANDLYAVGQKGRIFHYDGRAWERIAMPTNYDLHAVICAQDRVFVAGGAGALFVGSKAKWTQLDQVGHSLHSLTLFQSQLYIGAGNKGLFKYDGTSVNLVKDNIFSFSLGSSDRHLTASGNDEVARYDGTTWEAVGY